MTVAKVLALALPLATVACRLKGYYVVQPPTLAFREFGSVKVHPFALEQPDSVDEEFREEIEDLLRYLTQRLKEGVESLQGDGSRGVLHVKGSLIGCRPNDPEAEFRLSCSWGLLRTWWSGVLQCEVAFEDDQGITVGKMRVFGQVPQSAFQGTLRGAGSALTNSAIAFLKRNHQEPHDKEEGLSGKKKAVPAATRN